MPFTLYDPAVHTPANLVNAIILNNTGISLVPGAIDLKYGTIYDYYSETPGAEKSSISFYNGSLPLNIGAGLLLTSGNGAPPLTNTSSSYGRSFNDSSLYGSELDPQLQAIANAAFSGAGNIRDASILTFQVQVTDPSVQSVRFDLVFGSDEYPEYADSSFVDIGAVLVNDLNYALFNGQPNQPLSVIKTNLNLGNFIDNQNGVLPIEYDGVSKPLTVIAPVQQGLNVIKIGVADTGDQAYDSGLFVANLQGVGYTGGGLAQVVDITSASLDKPISVEAGNIVYQIPQTIAEAFFTFSPDNPGDTTILGKADTFIKALFDFSVGQVLDAFYDPFNALSETNSLTLATPFGQQALVGADLVLFKDAAFGLDTLAGGNTWQAYTILKAAFGANPDQNLLSAWVKVAQDVSTFSDLASVFLHHYAPVGFTTQDLVSHLLNVFTGTAPSAEVLDNAMSFLAGQGLNTDAAILAFAAENLVDTTGFAGSIQPLDLGYFI